MRAMTMSILFTDLVGSTEILVTQGAERGGALRREHDRFLNAVVIGHGGQVIKSTGDGLMAVFDSAHGALHAANAAHRAADRLELRWRDIPVRLRIGVSIGEAIEEHGDWHGQTVVEAARLCDLAGARSTLITAPLAAVSGADTTLSVRDVGLQDLKGIGSVDTCELVPPERVDGRAVVPPAIARALSPQLVGRDESLVALQALSADTLSGTSRVAVVSGEPGIGKSSLVAAFACELAFSGWRVLHGRCDPDVLLPFQPIVEALGDILTDASTSDRFDFGNDHAGELFRLFPTLDPGSAGQPDAHELGTQRELFDSIASVIRELGESRPTLIVIEDLQWAPADTRKLVTHLATDARQPGVLLLITCRYSDGPSHDPGAATPDELGLGLEAVHLELSGLDADAIEELVEVATSGVHQHRAELIEVVLDTSGGNPLFAEQLAEHLGSETDRDPRWLNPGPLGMSPEAIPTGVKVITRQRLAKLDDTHARVLGAAATCGDSFTLGLVGPVVGLDEQQLASSIGALVNARFLQQSLDDPARLHFSHPVVRSAISDSLSDARRARHHCRIAQVLSEIDEHERTDEQIAALAWHGCEGVRGGIAPREVAHWASLFANRAIDQLAPDDALAVLDAMSQVTGDALDDPETMFEVLAARLRAHERRLDTAATRSAYISAVDAAIEAGQPEWIGELKPLAALGQQGTDDPELYDRFDRVLDLLGDRDSPTRARALALRAWREMIQGRRVDAEQTARIARAIAERVAPPTIAAGTQLVHGLTLLHPSTLPAAVDALGAAAESAGAGDGSDECVGYELSAMRFSGIALLTAGDRSFLDTHLDDTEAVADERGITTARAHARQIRAFMALFDGDLRAAEEGAGRILEVAADEPNYQLGYAALLQAIRREQGRSAEMLDFVQMLTTVDPDNTPVCAILAQMLLELGQLNAGCELLERTARLEVDQAFTHWLGPMVLCVLADAACIADDATVASMLLPRLSDYAGLMALSPSGVVCLGAIDRFIGQIHLTSGATEAAVAHLDRAADLERGLGAPICLARTLAWRADAERRRGAADDAAATAAFEEAFEIADRLDLYAVSNHLTRITSS